MKSSLHSRFVITLLTLASSSLAPMAAVGADYRVLKELPIGGSGKVVATIPLSGKPEAAAADPKAERVYCNIENKNEIAVIDTKAHQVVSTWPIAPGEEASGMAIDLEHHRLFIGCHNKLMEMIDSNNGKVIASVPIGEGVDANAFDPGTRFAFSSTGEGTVTVAREDTPEKLTVIQTLK